jgi:Ca2+-binding RTX toxin-like protein
VIDALEPRRLCSVTLEATRTLVITGTPGNDFITVDLDIGLYGERTLRITENGTVTQRIAQFEVVDMLILCGDGNDFVRIGSGGFAGSVPTPAQIEGQGGNDEINGGFASDVIFGGDGDDFLTGYEGNDFIDAGPGNDTVVVHIGNDTVFGGEGDDELNGMETGRSSSFDGGPGNDEITGTSRRDTITGGSGNDIIDGGRGADRVFAGDGDDTITVTARSARLYGEGGRDTFIGRGRRGVRDFVPGEDTLLPPAPTSGTGFPAGATPTATALVREGAGDVLA